MTKLTVLGTSAAWPAAGRACSGYLLESDGVTLELDLGYGTLSRLLELSPPPELGGVFITHAHADHAVDLHGLYRVLTLSRPPVRSPPIFVAPNVLERVAPLEGPRGVEALARGLDLRPAAPGRTYELGPFRLRTFSLPHFTPDLGVRVEVGGRVIAYTGDTGPSEEIVALARDADLFVCEATCQGVPTGDDARFLLSASAAGRYARSAGAKRLLLTHFWPGDDREVSRREAAREFGGAVELAREGTEIALG